MKNLEVNDIIEDITNESNPWLNPLVVVPKRENDETISLVYTMQILLLNTPIFLC